MKVIAAAYLAMMTALCIYSYIQEQILPLAAVVKVAALIIGGVLTAFAVLYLLGRPLQAIRYETAFVRLGFTDALGMPPEIELISGNSERFMMQLMNIGKSLSEWNDHRAEIEAMLGVVISKLYIGRGDMRVILECVDGEKAFLPHETVSGDQSQGLSICIGYRADGNEIIDFDKTAHVLIGGATGSGKTVLLQSILAMLIRLKCRVYICDFKGGIDFPDRIWDEAEIVTNYDELIAILESAVCELEDRKRQFLIEGVRNIGEYNSLSNVKHLPHIVIASDEVAEMLDRTGRKDIKDKIDKVTELLSTVARLGRAYGIHLIVATQRPDATVIPGQIKNNLTYRACGRADKTLSQIVIDSTAAADIPPETPGRFITDAGIEFQARMLGKGILERR